MLLAEALKNPLNVKFVLVAHDAIPLYPPYVIWAQVSEAGRGSQFHVLQRFDAKWPQGRKRVKKTVIQVVKGVGPEKSRSDGKTSQQQGVVVYTHTRPMLGGAGFRVQVSRDHVPEDSDLPSNDFNTKVDDLESS